MLVSGMSPVRRSRWLSNSGKVSTDSSCGLEPVQLVIFSRKAGERLGGVGPHLHFENSYY